MVKIFGKLVNQNVCVKSVTNAQVAPSAKVTIFLFIRVNSSCNADWCLSFSRSSSAPQTPLVPSHVLPIVLPDWR